MNYFHLIFLCQLVFVKGGFESFIIRQCTNLQSKYPSLLLHYVRLRIKEHDNVNSYVNLHRIKRVLANENLPIWILTHTLDEDCSDNDDCSKLKRTYKVMKELGEFTIYQDAKTTAAAIYFHKRREFDGMINYKFLIQNLSVDKIHVGSRKTLILNRSGVYARPGYEGHTNDRELNEKDPDAGVNHQGDMKTHKSLVYEGYPEVLVIVSWNVAENWIEKVQEADHYTTIVSHVLTLFNGVDMLYSKLKNTKIKINIAGIIIGRAKESFHYFQECYYPRTIDDENTIQILDGSCVNGVLRRFLDARRGEIPPDSYDMAIFLTRENIYNINTNSADNSFGIFQQVGGISSSVEDLYDCRKSGEHVILVGTVTVEGYLDRYPTIAHEMAHLMTLNHDESSLFTPGGECSGNLLKIVEKWCDKCLSWSETSEKTFRLFFSSPNCCAFINEPRSLRPPKQSVMLTAGEQCRCYGYMNVWHSNEGYSPSYCYDQLQCWSVGNEFYPTVIPMDGTPCGNKKVCWGNSCQDL